MRLVEVLRERDPDVVVQYANKIYVTGNIPTPMQRSTFAAIPKKPGAMDCNRHRTISVMTQLGKIDLRINLNRNLNKIRPEISEEQYGFVKGNGTTKTIFLVRVLSDRAIYFVSRCFHFAGGADNEGSRHDGWLQRRRKESE